MRSECYLILIVSSIPEYRSCSSTTGMSNFIGHLSLFGFRHRMKNGLQLAMEPRRACRESWNLAAT